MGWTMGALFGKYCTDIVFTSGGKEALVKE